MRLRARAALLVCVDRSHAGAALAPADRSAAAAGRRRGAGRSRVLRGPRRPLPQLRDGVYYLNAVDRLSAVDGSASTRCIRACRSASGSTSRSSIRAAGGSTTTTPRCSSRTSSITTRSASATSCSTSTAATRPRSARCSRRSNSSAASSGCRSSIRPCSTTIAATTFGCGPARSGAVSGAVAAARFLAARLVDRERLVSMAIAKRIRSAFLTLLAVLGILLWLIALLSFTRVTENTDDFAQRLIWILLDQLRRHRRAAVAHREQPVAARARLSAARAGLAPARAHGLGARDGRDHAARRRLHLLRRVHQSRHRQLAQRRRRKRHERRARARPDGARHPDAATGSTRCIGSPASSPTSTTEISRRR